MTVDSKKSSGVDKPVDGLSSVSELDQQEQTSLLKPHGNDSDGNEDGVTAQAERQVSPDKLYRAGLLKNRFTDTILKAQEKPLVRMIRGILRNFDVKEKSLRCTRKERRLNCKQKPRLRKLLEGEQKQKLRLT